MTRIRKVVIFLALIAMALDYKCYQQPCLLETIKNLQSTDITLRLDLRQPGEFSDDLFVVNQPAEASRVMAVLDEINGRWGR